MAFSFDDQALLISSLENADLVLIGPGLGKIAELNSYWTLF